jgi:uncharacterized protein YggE
MPFKLIAIAALAAGQATSSFGQPVIQAVPERPRIIVDGYGEVRTPPDLAVVTYTLRGEGATSDDAVRAMVAQGTRIDGALAGLDRKAVPLTGDLKVTPVRSDDCKETDYGSPQLSTGPCAVLGYVARQSVTVRTAAVRDAGTMVGVIGRGGGFDAQISSFDLRDPRAAQREATAAALADAAAKASAIAGASRVALGPILAINTSSRQDGQEIIVTSARELASAPAVMAVPVRVEITPDPIKTPANVTITYAIDR